MGKSTQIMNFYRFNEIKRSHSKTGKKQTSPEETIIDADFAVDPALLTNTSAQVKYLLHSLEHTVRCICLYVNSNKAEFMRLRQDSTIYSLNCMPLELINLFFYFGSNISSTEILSPYS